MKIVKIIVFAGISVGGTDNIKLKLENDKAATIIPIMMINIFIEGWIDKKIIPNTRGINENITPNIEDPQTLPNKTVFIEIGQVINRSSVCCLVSHGNTTGPIDVDVKNKTMAINPEIMYIGSIFRPIVKAKKSITGNKIPCITTGPLL
jgi:hypothetical protein